MEMSRRDRIGRRSWNIERLLKGTAVTHSVERVSMYTADSPRERPPLPVRGRKLLNGHASLCRSVRGLSSKLLNRRASLCRSVCVCVRVCLVPPMGEPLLARPRHESSWVRGPRPTTKRIPSRQPQLSLCVVPWGHRSHRSATSLLLVCRHRAPSPRGRPRLRLRITRGGQVHYCERHFAVATPRSIATASIAGTILDSTNNLWTAAWRPLTITTTVTFRFTAGTRVTGGADCVLTSADSALCRR